MLVVTLPLSLLQGVGRFYRSKKRHVITTQTEHKCVLDSCRVLQSEGFEITYLPVMANGLVDLEVHLMDAQRDHIQHVQTTYQSHCVYYKTACVCLCVFSCSRPPSVLTPLWCRWCPSTTRSESGSPSKRWVGSVSSVFEWFRIKQISVIIQKHHQFPCTLLFHWESLIWFSVLIKAND